jgi:hypothetical protein
MESPQQFCVHSVAGMCAFLAVYGFARFVRAFSRSHPNPIFQGWTEMRPDWVTPPLFGYRHRLGAQYFDLYG